MIIRNTSALVRLGHRAVATFVSAVAFGALILGIMGWSADRPSSPVVSSDVAVVDAVPGWIVRTDRNQFVNSAD